MKQKFIYPKSSINTAKYLRQGESIEEKMRRVTQTQEPIDDNAPPLYQEKNSGVDPACDVRTDRFDLALEAIEKANNKEASEVAETEHKPITEHNENQETITYITE